MGRTRLDPAARRAQLIELGVEMLATRTLDELSVEEIARQAGISRGLLFHYFASKQDFHVEVARAAATELLTRTEPDPELAPLAALRGALAAFVAFVAERPDSYKSLVRGAASSDGDLQAIFDATRSTMAGRVVAVLGELGLPHDAHVELAVHGWVAFVEECVVRSVEGGALDRAEELVGLLVRALPAVVLAATEEQFEALLGLLAADRAAALVRPPGQPLG